MHFTHLKLHGFKSFVEPTELNIQSGLTGIVGPNGCGKSNLVEALRWVMGENSAKRMRGTEMDDVIFAGTATRPSRNFAEVSLVLDNATRQASAEFNDTDELVITRKIERASGSDYRLNGKPLRQRDVQMLFADQATGAHSTSVVGQGQIDALIRAKPQDRRQILEEAAGTSGLHARRHEAELKLKGAEQNLTRVDDVLHTLDGQLRSLKQQVRQASRYRNLADHIRRTEAALLHLRWAEAEGNAAAMQEALAAAGAKVTELTSIVTQGSTQRTEIAAELPSLRQNEATAAAIVQKLTLARDQIDAEANRIAHEIQQQEARLHQTISDHEREKLRQHDGAEALDRLTAEDQQLKQRLDDIAGTLPGFEIATNATSEIVAQLDQTLNELMALTAQAEAQGNSLKQEMQALIQKQTSLSEKRAQLDAQRLQLAESIATRPDLALAVAMVDACEIELAKRQDQAAAAEQACRDAEAAQTDKSAAAQQAQSLLTKLQTEADTIAAMLAQHDQDAQQVIDSISVTPGLEKALAVALGEALTAALDPAAASHWRELAPYAETTKLPSGAIPFAQFVEAPPALQRAVGGIGLVEDKFQGENLATLLMPGQILVSRDGWAWRWDGFTVSPQAVTTSAMRLQQRNRLAALAVEIAAATTEVHVTAEELASANAILTACKALDQQARASLQAAFAAINDARNNFTKLEREAAAANTQLTNLQDQIKQLAAELDAIRIRAQEIETTLAALPEVEGLKASITTQRISLSEQRSQLAQHQSERDRLSREQQAGQKRLASIQDETTAWQNRMAAASDQIGTLAERIVTLQAELAGLREKPAILATQRGQLLDELTAAEATRRAAADLLIAAEQKLSVVEHQLKRDEAELNEARENRVRAEAALQAAHEHFNVLQERMAEKLNCTREELQTIAGYGSDEAWPSLSELEQALARYVRERENMGPVNLRAEVEAETVQADIDRLTQEKDDLVAAIGKLRQGIGQLNREARDRLQVAFTAVNERFQVLFQRLFNGGKAHLELLDNDDPMNAGLEIFASPPGKKLQVLSLLSGGERTLTALALLFAVFQTNPSPICVLDEAEAALDESNIGRFCSLVEDIARETGTRFLIITHQRLTMARMDRLYGVTMGEKGVSQLVSVDLNAAVAIRDGATYAPPSQQPASTMEKILEDVQAA